MLWKWPFYQKTIHRFSTIPIKFILTYFKDVEKNKISYYGNTKDPWYPKQFWSLKTLLKVSLSLISSYTTELLSSKQHDTVIKIRHIGKWNRSEVLNMNPDPTVILFLTNRQQIHMEERIASSQMAMENWIATCK